MRHLIKLIILVVICISCISCNNSNYDSNSSNSTFSPNKILYEYETYRVSNGEKVKIQIRELDDLNACYVAEVIPDEIIKIFSDKGFTLLKHSYILNTNKEPMIVRHNPNARKVSYDELLKFLKADNTDKLIYKDETFDCTEFAQTLYNNAEEAGITAQIITVYIQDIDNPENITFHVCNAFNVTDKEPSIFIDCTGIKEGQQRECGDTRIYTDSNKTYYRQCLWNENIQWTVGKIIKICPTIMVTTKTVTNRLSSNTEIK